MSIRSELSQLLAPALESRGDAGKVALRWLRGDQVSPQWAKRLAEAPLQPGPPDPRQLSLDGPTIDLGEPRRFVLIGDIHGRWDRVEPVLQELDLVDGDGDWCGGANVALVQVGDLLDADLRWWSSSVTDPDGSALREKHHGTVRGLIQSAPAAAASELEAEWESPTWSTRHHVASVALVVDSLRRFMRLDRQARLAGSSVIALMGNHELDLLSGRHWWYPSQKARLRSLLSAAELVWLADRPWLARVGRVLLMHGGPTRDLSDRLRVSAPVGLAALGAWLRSIVADPTDFTGDFFAENDSLFSPRRRREDVASEESLVQPWLAASDCDLLAVGHSPFLAFDPSAWVDPSEPHVRERLASVERLGTYGQIVKLDTNLKRGDRAEVVHGAQEGLERVWLTGRSALTGTGTPPVLSIATVTAGETLLAVLDRHRRPEVADLVEAGIDGEEFAWVFAELAQWREEDEPAAAAAQASAMAVLTAFPSTTAHVRRALLGRAHNLLADTATSLAAHVASSSGAVSLDTSPWRLQLEPSQCSVDGVRYRLIDRVVEALLERADDAGVRARAIIAGELVARRDRPHLRLSHFAAGKSAAHTEVWLEAPPDAAESWGRLTAWARSELWRCEVQLATPRALPTPSAPLPPAEGTSPRSPSLRVSRSAWERLVAVNSPLLAGRDPGVRIELVDDDSTPGVVRLAGEPRLSLVVTTRGEHILADTAFTAPGCPTTAVVLREGAALETDATALILGTIPIVNGRWTLHSSLSLGAARRLASGDAQGLALGGTKRAPWRSGCFLFAAAEAAVAADFSDHNPVGLVVEVEVEVAVKLIRAGLWGLGLMVSDGGDERFPSSYWGHGSVAVEVVAIGADGVEEMWIRRRREASS